MKTVVFRVDSGHHFGMGHITRCLTLAKELAQRRCAVHFLSKNHIGSSLSSISREFKLHVLKNPVEQLLPEIHKNNYQFWLGSTEKEDLEQTNIELEKIENVDLTIIDHYSLSKSYEIGLKSKRIMVIDDLCCREHECHVLLNQNLGVKETDYSHASIGAYMLGPQYALLRPEFREKHQQMSQTVQEKDGIVKTILVFFGFGDVGGNCLKLAHSLRGEDLDEYSFTFLLNSNHRDFSALTEWANTRDKKVKVMSYSTNMVGLMMENDFCIGAGGATSWERASIGMPSAVIELAENQAKIYHALIDQGWAYGLGKSEDLTSEKWNHLFQISMRDRKQIKDMSQKAYSGVDGLGAERVANKIMDLI